MRFEWLLAPECISSRAKAHSIGIRVQTWLLQTSRPRAHPVTSSLSRSNMWSRTFEDLLRSGTNRRACQAFSPRGTMSRSSSAPTSGSVPPFFASAMAFSDAPATRPHIVPPQGPIAIITLPFGLPQRPSSPRPCCSARRNASARSCEFTLQIYASRACPIFDSKV